MTIELGTRHAVRIRLCGTLSVHVDGREAGDALSGRQGRLLLAYLVANRGEPVRRDELIDVVWQGRLPRAPEASLSSLLTGVRRTLGQDALTGRSVLTLTLPADGWIDVEAARDDARAAEAALAGGDPAAALERARAALALIGQPVLAEMAGPWVEQLRAEIAQMRCDLLETATRSAIAVGELAAAERLARRLVELEPYRESGYGLLMEALALGGNVAEALLAFDSVRVMLRDELGAPPAPALTALHERLLGQLAPSPRTASAAPELPLPGIIDRSERRTFVARGAERRRLHDRWAQVRRGQGMLVLLTGEPGIGKTRLASRFAAEVHATGALVIYGRADEETVVPYQPVAEALRHLVAHADSLELDPGLTARLGPLLPELPRSPAEDGRHALFEAAAALLERVARRRPLLVVLEDVHWADTPTLLLLRELVRRAEAAPIMVLATYSDVALAPSAPLQRVLADLRRDQVPERISLVGLDVGATEALVAERGRDGVDVRRLQEYTAGNPFFIEETLRSVSSSGVPEGAREVLLQRFERLSPDTLDLLTLAAVLGRDFSLGVLELLAGRPVEDVVIKLEEAVDAGLIVETAEPAGRFSFCHALVCDALHARPAASRRRLLHLRAGEALERARGRVEVPAGELAHHFFLARHAGGAERAARYAVEAGEQAARAHAYEDAARHFERALEALDLIPEPDDAVRAEIWLALGTVRWQGGEPAARAAFDAAAEIAARRGDKATLVRAALGAGGRFYAPGRRDPARVELLERALRSAGPGDARIRTRLLGRLAEALTDDVRRVEVSTESLRLARATREPAILAPALLSHHAAHLHTSHLDARLELAGEAVELADAASLREIAALARHWLIYDLVEAGDLEAARSRHAELASLARDLRQPLYEHSALAWRGVWAQLAGRCDEAERLAREGLRLAVRAGAVDARAHFTAQLLPILRDQDRLPELLPELERLVAERSEVLGWRAVLPLAYLDAGETAEAARTFAAALADVPDGLLWLPATAWLAEAAARLEDTDACTALLSRLEPYAGRVVQASFTGCWGAVDRFLGLLTGALGRRADAERHLAVALARHLDLGAGPLADRTGRELARRRLA